MPPLDGQRASARRDFSLKARVLAPADPILLRLIERAHPMTYLPRRTACKALLSFTLLLGAGWAGAQSFNMITPAELKKRLESGDKPMLVDIQPCLLYTSRCV